MSDRTKSAVDAIYAIEELLEKFEKRFSSIEAQVKILNQKVDKAIKSSKKEDSVVGSPSAKPPVGSPKPAGEVKKLVLGSVKAFGYIVNKNKEPIQGVDINIYDEENDVIKKIQTNNDGYWSARLPSGRFGIEYIHKKFKPINRTISIPEGVSEFEVR